jgi:hypothetical protein
MRLLLATHLLTLALIFSIGGLAGCSSAAPKNFSAPERAIHLTATLISPIDIALEWKDHPPNAAGFIVEFATEPDGEYTIIRFLPPNQTRFLHPDLMPQTAFYYRVRACYGPSSSPVEVTMPEPLAGENPDKDSHSWAYPQTLSEGAQAAKESIRGVNTAAAPTDLKATIMHSRGILFTWSDRSCDEEGYLLEVKPQGSQEFEVAAVLDPNINSFGLITLPNEKRASFRVRAFYYGKPSNLVHEITGLDRQRS